MTVYVDAVTAYPDAMIAPAAKHAGDKWSHMWCDGDLEELHAMAARIGLKRAWFQQTSQGKSSLPHYDLVPSKRRLAVEAGAVEMSYLDYLVMTRGEDEGLG
jgi:hypothetical protein